MAEYSPWPDKPHRQLFMPDPKLPVGAVKTYQILQPVQTHFRLATCEEVGCVNFQKGWKIQVPTGGSDESVVKQFIRAKRSVVKVSYDGETTVFLFEAGNVCFAFQKHRVSRERDQIFVVRNGDWRSYGTPHKHSRAADWVDDFATHQDKIATRIGRG